MAYLCYNMKERSIDTLPLDGGALPFHLINTVHAWKGENEHEYLKSYDDFLAWSVKVKLLKKAELQQLKSMAANHPIAAKTALQQIIETRLLLYRFFSALASGNKPTLTPLLAKYNAATQEALAHFAWQPSGQELQFTRTKAAPDLLLPLWLVLKEAHDLLLTNDQTRIKECPRCGWIFLDTTKNKTRKWCSPQGCGCIEKSKKYYRKKVKALKS